MKKVSVIIPVFNAEKFIEETVDSVLNQSYSNIEVILVNDGSTDNTSKFLEKYLDNPKVKIIHQKNAGVNAARNTGIKNSTGEILAFVDADDIWLIDNLKFKVEVLFSEKEIGAVFSSIYFMDSDSEIGKEFKSIDYINLETLLRWHPQLLTTPSTYVIKKEVFDTIGLFDENFSTAGDQDITYRIAEIFKIKKSNKSTVLYRIHNQNMHSNIALMEKDHTALYLKAEKNGLFKSFWFKQKCFSNFYLILAGSWWKNGNNKIRGVYFLFKSIATYPPNIFKLIYKGLIKCLQIFW